MLLRRSFNIIFFAVIFNISSFVSLSFFSVYNVIVELSDVSLLLGEYAMFENFKFADISQVIVKVESILNKEIYYDKENDDLPLLREELIEENMRDKINNFRSVLSKNRKSEYANEIRMYFTYSEYALKAQDIRKNILENASEMAGGVNLIDPSKIPRDLILIVGVAGIPELLEFAKQYFLSLTLLYHQKEHHLYKHDNNQDLGLELIESDYITKLTNKAFTRNTAPKSSIDSYDVLNLLKSFYKEIDYFNINFLHCENNDEKIKNLEKLHKFLKLNLSSYSSKCTADFTPLKSDDNLNLIDFIADDQINVSYQTMPLEVFSHLSGLNEVPTTKYSYVNLVYFLGNNSGKRSKLSTPKESVKDKSSKNSRPTTKAGKSVDKANKSDNNLRTSDVSKEDILYGRVLVKADFLRNMNKQIFSLRTRLRSSLTLSEEAKNRDVKYFQLEYLELVFSFLHEFLLGKKQFAEVKKVKEAFSEKEMGEISLENLDFWLNFTGFKFYRTENMEFNALLRKAHKLLIN